MNIRHIFILFDAQFNLLQIVLIQFLYSSNGLVVKIRLKFMSKFYFWILSELLWCGICKSPTPNKNLWSYIVKVISNFVSFFEGIKRVLKGIHYNVHFLLTIRVCIYICIVFFSYTKKHSLL
jgi:hypothetical protein